MLTARTAREELGDVFMEKLQEKLQSGKAAAPLKEIIFDKLLKLFGLIALPQTLAEVPDVAVIDDSERVFFVFDLSEVYPRCLWLVCALACACSVCCKDHVSSTSDCWLD